MHDMSNTRKEIAARLGFAAGNGAKAEFAMKVDMPEIRAEFLGFDVDSNGNKIARFKKYSGETVRIQTNGNLPKSHRMTNQSLDAKAIEQEVLSSSYASKFALKPRSSRPGAKTAFANNDPELANFLVKYKENENNNYHSENVVLLAEFVGSSSEIAHAKDILRKVRAAGHLPSDLNDEQYSLYKNLAAKLKSKYPGAKFSRPGAKAKFEISSYEQAEYQIALSEERIASYRKALANTEAMIRNANSLMRTADSGDKKAMKEVIGIARMLESTMKSRGFSRPGAKDEFGGMKGLGDWTVGFTDVMKERIAQLKQLAKSLKATVTLGRVSPNGMYSGTVTRRYGPMEPPDLMAPKKVEQLIKSLGGYENDSWRYNARPGTKTRMTREQTEEQKAGLKIMSAADPAVGAKIAKLIKEGKPQDQAVAIALDMKRRGEL